MQVNAHEHNRKCGCIIRSDGLVERVYEIKNLCCAVCADKIENRLRRLPYVENVAVTVTTNLLKISSYKDPDEFFPLIQKICEGVRHDVDLLRKEDEHCNHCHHHHEHNKNNNKEIFWGSIIFVLGFMAKYFMPHYFSAAFFICAYIILARDVIFSGFKNFFKGQFLDENFLMSIATFGAFFIREFPEAVAVILFFRIGELFEHKAVEKSRQSIIDAISLKNETANLLVDGQEIKVNAEDLNIGDIILIKNGERVPVDGVILEGESNFDVSYITGENIPKTYTIGEKVFSGSLNLFSPIKLKVESKFQDSMVSRILQSVEDAASRKPKIDRFLTRFANIYTPIVVILSVCLYLVLKLIFNKTLQESLYTSLLLLVISCPCALVLSIPLVFFTGLGRAAKSGILFKSCIGLEMLAKIKTVVFDKTGTLTKGNFLVQKVESFLDEVPDEMVLKLAFSIEKYSNHPIAKSICKFYNGESFLATEVKEYAGQGIEGKIDDKKVVCGDFKFLKEIGIDVDKEKSDGILIAVDKICIGRILLGDTIKEDAVKTINLLKKKKIFTALITGDLKYNADTINKKIGVNEVYADVLPHEKLKVLRNIRYSHGRVMFIGDGINDAPAIAGADIGAAMGTGAEATIEISDLVFMNSNLSSVNKSINISKAVKKVAVENIVISLAIKFIIMVLSILGKASMWMAVFADTGVAVLCVLNSMKILKFSLKD